MSAAFVYENRLRSHLPIYPCVLLSFALMMLATRRLDEMFPQPAYDGGLMWAVSLLTIFAAYAPSVLFILKALPRLSAMAATAAMDEDGLMIALPKERLTYRWADIQSITYKTDLLNLPYSVYSYTGLVIESSGKRRIFAHSGTDGKHETDDSSLYRFYVAARAQWIESNARKWHK